MAKMGFAAALALCGSCGGGGGAGGGGSASKNQAPVVSFPNPDQVAYTFVEFSYDSSQGGTTFFDSDGGSLSYTVDFSPDANGLSANGGLVTGFIATATETTVTVTARDSAGASARDSFRITGAESIGSTMTCPANNSVDSGVNSGANLVLDGDIDPAAITAGSIALTCDGAPIDGVSNIVGDRGIQFVANNDLPPSASCNATLSGAIGTDGRPVRPVDWTFSTGTEYEFEWKKVLSTIITGFDRGATRQPAFGIHFSYFENGRHVVLFGLEGPSRVALSEDGGLSYQISEPMLGPEWIGVTTTDANFDYHDGQLFLTFRAQGRSSVTGLTTFEYVYVQSTTDLLTFSDPILVTNPDDLLSTFSPGVAAIDDRIYMSWRETECFGCPFDTPGQGVYLAEFDRADLSLVSVNLLNTDGRSPLIEAGDEVLLSWYRDIGPIGSPQYIYELYNHSEATTYLLDMESGGPGIIRVGDLIKVGPSTIQRTWIGTENQSTIKNLNNHVFDSSTHVLSYNHKSVTVATAENLQCTVKQATDRAGSIATSMYFGDYAPGVEIPIYFSQDLGATYEIAVKQDIWDDAWCPVVAVEDENTIFIAYADTGQQEDPAHTDLRSSKYTRGAPCQL